MSAAKLILPFPPASLSGHNNGGWRAKSPTVKKHRKLAAAETLKLAPKVRATGDIDITIRFVPPDRRSDRVNFPNRMKPYFDGIADALKVNDRRFHPLFIFAEPEPEGRVEIYIAQAK